MNKLSKSITENVNQRRAALREHIAWLCGIVEAKIEEDHISDKLKTQILTIVKTIASDFNELMQLRREDGFYEAILDHSPRVQHTVDQLRKEYDEMATELPEISEQLIDEDHALKTRRRLHSWLVHLESLDHREFDLLQKVWNTDISAGD